MKNGMICKKEYSFINQDLDCSSIDENAAVIGQLNKKIESIIDSAKKNGEATKVSVFYRDLNARRSFGVNDNLRVYPASLGKLPVAIMYYKLAELDSGILDRPIEVANEVVEKDIPSLRYPPKQLTTAGMHSPKELIAQMLIYSDNIPLVPLMKEVKIFQNRIFSDIGIYFPPDDGKGEGVWNVTAKSYANIFRMLYNASYLNLDSSNEILSTLSNADFSRGLIAGIPSDVRVAHKFGQANLSQGDGSLYGHVLSDCGIIYKPHSPYILCVMTEGREFESLEEVIRNISKTAYDTSLP